MHTQDERVVAIVDNLSSLIRSHAGMLASEQYMPSVDADTSDDRMREHTHWVKELREIRERFENLVTGTVP